MIPLLTIQKEYSNLTDFTADADTDLREIEGPFTFVITDSQTDTYLESSGPFDTYDEARLAGVAAVDRMLDQRGA